MGIIYLISIIALSLVFILFKKTEKKENIIFWIFLTLVLIICYNTFEVYILSLLKIKSYLITLAIINFILAILGAIHIKNKKQIQKYYLKKFDIIAIISIFIVVIVIAYQRYGANYAIKYESSDAATHYISAKYFYKNKTLLVDPEIKDRLFGFEKFMPTAYVNTGIAFDIVSNFVSESNFYIIYILFDIMVWYLGAVLFYLIITKSTNKRFLNITGVIISVLYMMAYPLNSMLFGFAYLSVSLVVIEAIIAIAPMIKKNIIELKYILPIGFLLTFTLFFSYYLFVPIVYMALGIYLAADMFKNRKKEKLFSIKNITIISILLIIPTILGFCYFILPGILEGEVTEVQAISAEGYIYRDLYTNLILIAPLILYYVIDKTKNGENDFINNSIIITAVIFLIMLIGILVDKVSTYYYFKIYFMFWIFAMIAVFEAIKKLYNNKNLKNFVYAYLIFYIGIHLYSMLNIDAKFQNRNDYINTEPLAKQITHIYSYNQNCVKNSPAIYTQEQKEILKYCENNNIFSNKDSIAVCANNLQQRWIYAIYEVADVSEIREFALIEKKFDIEEWLNSDKDYYLYINNGETVELNNENENYKVLYNNIGGAILERIN